MSKTNDKKKEHSMPKTNDKKKEHSMHGFLIMGSIFVAVIIAIKVVEKSDEEDIKKYSNTVINIGVNWINRYLGAKSDKNNNGLSYNESKWVKGQTRDAEFRYKYGGEPDICY
jgi:hypothetical protein